MSTPTPDATGKVLLTKDQIHKMAMKVANILACYVGHTKTEDLADNKMPEHEAAFTRIIEREIGAVSQAIDSAMSADTKGTNETK